MRKFILYFALTASIPVVSGCDFFRRIAGRPDSAEIAAKKAVIDLAEKTVRDSILAAQKHISDSIAIMDSIRPGGRPLVETRNLPEDTVKALAHRYYVIVGAFRGGDNASRLSREIGRKGYEVSLIRFNNGFTAVGLCPSDDLTDAFSALRNLYGEPFLPDDAWILDSRMGL